LNDPMCATMVPLYFGHDEDYLLSQQNRFALASQVLGFRRPGTDSRSELSESWRTVEEQLDIYLDKKVSFLRRKIEELDGQISSLDMEQDGASLMLKDLSQQHLTYTKQLDRLLSVNYEETRRVFRFHLLEAHWKLVSDSACYDKIYQKAMQEFSKERWLSQIEGVYNAAQGMRKTQDKHALVLKDLAQSETIVPVEGLRIQP
jgi:hypothetical protein